MSVSAPSAPHRASDRSSADRQARACAAIAQTRSVNVWFRMASCGIAAFASLAVVDNVLPLIWLAGLAPVLLVEFLLLRRLARNPTRGLTLIAAWTFLVSVYTNLLAGVLWFSGYLHGPTLAVIFVIAGLGNAAATLRGSGVLAMAGATPSVAAFLGLPLLDYALGGGANPLDLLPLIGAMLFLGFGANLWNSLRASDAAQAQAEDAAARERAAARAAAAAKTDVIRRMNAELRTPMAALIGAAEHLRRAAASPQARAQIATIAQAGEVLRAVLGDLSDLDQLENGAIRTEPRPTDLRELLRGVAGAFRAPASDKGLELFLDIAPEVPAAVEIDPVRLRQILFNLVANAVRYTSHGGVRLRLQCQQGLDASYTRLGFSVSDTGKGMSRSQLALLFGQDGADADGPGLGLPISLRLARVMGGRIGAKSELGQGTTVSLVLEARILGAAAAPGSRSAA